MHFCCLNHVEVVGFSYRFKALSSSVAEIYTEWSMLTELDFGWSLDSHSSCFTEMLVAVLVWSFLGSGCHHLLG